MIFRINERAKDDRKRTLGWEMGLTTTLGPGKGVNFGWVDEINKCDRDGEWEAPSIVQGQKRANRTQQLSRLDSRAFLFAPGSNTGRVTDGLTD